MKITGNQAHNMRSGGALLKSVNLKPINSLISQCEHYTNLNLAATCRHVVARYCNGWRERLCRLRGVCYTSSIQTKRGLYH